MKHFLLLSFVCLGLIQISAQPFSQTTVGSNINDPKNITRIDLDKDGDEDILSFGEDTNIEFYSNNGDATYTKTTVYTGPRGLSHFEVADMDNDGELDIVASDLLEELFVFLKNDGSENFTTTIISNDVDVLNNPYHFVIANFDADNYKDIVVCAQHAYDTYGVFFLKNNGNGTFAEPDEIIEDDFVNKIIAGDIDGDTDIDIIVSKSGMFTAGGLYKGINDGSGSFTYSALTTTLKFDEIKAANMDGDSDLDFVARTTTNLLYWYENDGSSSFTAHAITHPYSASNDVVCFYPINTGGDSDMDLFFYSSINGDTNMDVFDVGYFENDGSQNFSIQLFLEDQPEFSSAAPLDLDNDGDLDFYIASEDNSDIILYKNMEIDNPTAIETSKEINIQVYPNPASEILFIESAQNITLVELCDISGRTVKQVRGSNNKVSLDISSLSAGVYNVLIKTDRQTSIKRILKQ